MKSMFTLVVKKQWKQYLAFLLMIILTLGVVNTVQSASNKLFKMPIAIQDMDHSKVSQSLINDLRHTKYIEVINIPDDEAYIDDLIKKKEAVVSFQIPDDFSEKLEKNELKDAIQLYYKEDFVGNIALEVTSKTLYKQQIPVIIHKHLTDAKQNISINKIKKTYNEKTPQSQITYEAYKKNADISIGAGIIIALFLLIGCSQILLHRRINQHAAIERLRLYHGAIWKMYFWYVCTHVILIMTSVVITSMIMSWHLSWQFYIVTLIIVVIYELGMSLLLLKVQTISHRLFMAMMWAIAVSCFYLFLQI